MFNDSTTELDDLNDDIEELENDLETVEAGSSQEIDMRRELRALLAARRELIGE